MLLWSMPLLIYVWLVGMWAAMIDVKKRRIKEKKKMNWLRALGTTLLCVFVGVVGFGGGTWYTTDKLFEPLVDDVQEITNTARTILIDVKNVTSEKAMRMNLERIQASIEASIEDDLEKVSEDFDNVNERILSLSNEIMKVHMEIEQQLSDLEASTKSFIEGKITHSEEEVKKQLGEMYDRVDVLYKDLEKISNTIDTAKETFLGKYIIKE